MKKTILSILIIVAVGVVSYFYYIKPQREYIKMSAQDCIKKAMSLIDNEVNKGSYATHYDDKWFVEPLKKQKVELMICINLYNNLLFSKPEKNILEFNLNSLLDTQASKINTYKKAYLNIKSENQKKQTEIDKCNQLKIQFTKYNNCTSNALKNGQDSSRCSYPQDAYSDMFNCAMIGISF